MPPQNGYPTAPTLWDEAMPVPEHPSLLSNASAHIAPGLWAPQLTGRRALIAELRDHLSEGVLIVSGTGGAGIGATSVARRLAVEAAAEYPDGCVLINLRGGEPAYLGALSSSQVQRRILRALLPSSPPLPETSTDLRKLYSKTLAERRVLLILDDAASATQLRALLPRGNSTAIVTTQDELSSSFPKLYARALDGLDLESAYQMMAQTAPALADLSKSSLRHLVTRLQGVPLALRLVAPLLGDHPRLSPRRLMQGLDIAQRRIEALRGSRTLDMAVNVAMETAYELLDYEIKPYFEALAVFPAPFTAHAAATVWDVTLQQAEQILDQLTALALIDHQVETSHYEIHHLVRLYAQELLLGQPDRAKDLVARYVELMMRDVIQAWAPSDSASAVADTYLIWEHIPTAWRRATGKDPGWPPAPNMERWVCNFPIHGQPALAEILTQEELRDWLTCALAAAESLQDFRMMGVHLGELGKVSAALGEDQAALAYFERQLAVAQEHETGDAEGEALMHVGVAYGALGDIQQANASWQRALTLFERTGDQRAGRIRVWLKELHNRIGTPQ